MPDITVKLCPKCGEEKPLSAWFRNASRPDGLQAWCKTCHSGSTNKKLSGPNRDRHLRERRSSHLYRKYKITADEYDALLARQGGGCRICGRVGQENGRALAVDHDHDCCPGETSCGKCVRSILCQRCNQGLGMFGHSVERLREAADYISITKAFDNRAICEDWY